MSAMMLLKIFSDCCICFAILGSGPVDFAVSLLVPALICGVAAGMATFCDRKGWYWPRRLCCVLPFAVLFLAQGIGQALILAVAAVYTVVVILRGKLSLDYSGYRYFFVRSLWLLGAAFAIAEIWLFFELIAGEPSGIVDAGVILRYGLVHLLCGVVLQRQLRLGVGYRAEGGRRQMTVLLGTAAAIALGFLMAEPLLRSSLRAVLNYLVSLILLPFAFLFSVVAKLLAKLQTEQDKETFEHFVDYLNGVLAAPDGGVSLIKPQPTEPGKELDLTVVWVVLAVVLVLIAAVLLIRSFRKRMGERVPSDLTSRLLAAPKKKKLPLFSNRARVRQLYRDFLRLETDLGLKLRPNDTSADVLSRLHPRTDKGSAADLRQVYLRARYDDRDGINRSQLDAAKRAFKGTRHTK